MNKIKAIIKFETELNTIQELKELKLYIKRQLNLRNLEVELLKDGI